MEIRKVRYPFEADSEGENSWYKFGMSDGAVSISDSEIEEWINMSIQSVKQQLENGIESPYSYTASGDTMVICFYSQDCENLFDDNNYFVVIVTKNYEEGTFFIEDLKEVKKSKEDEIRDLKDRIKILSKKLEEKEKESKEQKTNKKDNNYGSRTLFREE